MSTDRMDDLEERVSKLEEAFKRNYPALQAAWRQVPIGQSEPASDRKERLSRINKDCKDTVARWPAEKLHGIKRPQMAFRTHKPYGDDIAPEECPKCGADRASGTHCPPEKQPCPFDRADHWRTHTHTLGTEPPPDLAPAQMVEWRGTDGKGCWRIAARAVPWSIVTEYRPLLDPDGLPYVSAEGLEPWAECVATDYGGLPFQYAQKPHCPQGRLFWRNTSSAVLVAPATHAIPGDWRQSLARVWRDG